MQTLKHLKTTRDLQESWAWARLPSTTCSSSVIFGHDHGPISPGGRITFAPAVCYHLLVAPALENRRRRTTSPAAPVVTGDLLTPSQSQAAASRWAARGSSDPVILTLQPPRLHYSGRPIGAAGCRARDTYGSGDAVAAGVQPRPADGGVFLRPRAARVCRRRHDSWRRRRLSFISERAEMRTWILFSTGITSGNISGGNRPLHTNYENFNLSHTMLIQRRSHGRWKG
jgi:hypothetical protein